MTTEPLMQPSSSLSSMNAARWNVQVLVGGTRGAGDEVWMWWNGLTKFEPSQDPTTQADTTIFSRGFKSSQVTATSEDVAVEGMAQGKRGQAGVVPLDPGTKFVRAKRRLTGEDNEITLRYWRSDELDDDDATVQTFSVKWKDVGGGQEDLQKYTAELGGRGAPDLVARPEATANVLAVPADVTEFTYTVDGNAAVIDNSPPASALAISTALEALPNIIPGDVMVTSVSATNGTKFLVVFTKPVGVQSVVSDPTGATLSDPV